jgi:hypothetical protein
MFGKGPRRVTDCQFLPRRAADEPTKLPHGGRAAKKEELRQSRIDSN